jgi:hypothetical protein
MVHTAFVREPHLALDPHGRWSLLRHPNLRRCGGDRVVVPHARHLAVLLRRLDVRDLVRAGVPRRAAGLLGELGERRGGEGREEVRHGVPGATDDRAVVRAGAGADAGGSRETGHGGGEREDVGGRAWRIDGWISLAQEPRRTKVFVVGRSSSDLICVPCSRHWRSGNPVKGYDVF